MWLWCKTPGVRIIVALVFLCLTGCKDLLTKPLGGLDAPDSSPPLVGNWLSESGTERLIITKTGKQDWYSFTYQEQGKKTEGRFIVSYFKRRLVFNVDLASVRINDRPAVSSETPVYMLLGVIADDESLQVSPANMDKFERHFAKYFFASPINTKALCTKTSELCSSSFASGNLLLSKRLRKFNDDFIKKFRTVFPRATQVVFKRV